MLFFINIFIFTSLVFSSNIFNSSMFQISKIDGKSTEILFHAPEISITRDTDGYSKFEDSDLIGLNSQNEEIIMPVYSTAFQMNPGYDYEINFEVINSHTIEDVNFKNFDDNNTGFFPNQNINLSEPQIMRGLVLGQVSFTPYKYFIDEKKLEIYDAVQINITETNQISFDYFIPEKKSYIFDELYEDLVINYSRSDRSEDYQTPSILYICGGSSINNAYFQELVNWRHKQGYIVTVVSTNETGSSENNINNYIENAYLNWENPPEIVGLVGDVGGTYNIDCDSYEWGGYYGASDVKYTYIEGNDLLPEVVIGRISANGTSDLYNLVNKTIEYEKAQQQTDLGWYDRAGLVGDPTTSGLSCAITNQYIDQVMEIHGFDDIDLDINGGGNQLNEFLIDQFNRGIMYYNYRGFYFGEGSYPPNSNDLNNGYYTPFVSTITCGTGDFNGTSSSEGFVRMGSVNDPKGAVAAVGTSTTGTHTAYNNIVNMGLYEGLFSKEISLAGSAVTNGRLALYNTYPSNPGDCVGAFAAWTNLIGDPALHLWTDKPKDFSVEYPSTMILGNNYLDLTILDSNGNPVKDARVTLLMKDNGESEEESYTFTGQYYSSPGTSGSPSFGDLVLTREDDVINFEWGNGSPDNSIPSDDFQVRWTTTLNAEVSGTYNFRTYTDDGLRLYINDELVIDYWNDQGPTNRTGSIFLNEGTHECVMEYYENGGGAVAGLYWTPPGQSESLVHGDQDENIADDAIFLTKLTDENGKINFLWDEYQEGDMFITVTKRNYRPFEGVIQINSNDGYAIVPDYSTLQNYITDTSGNNDNNVNPGEIININIPISNFGDESIDYLNGTLSSTSEYVTIIDAESAYSDLEVDQVGIGDGFVFQLSNEAVFGDDIELLLNMESNDNQWTFYIPVDISSPKINILDYAVISGSNEPGASIELSVNVINDGNLPIDNLILDIISPTNKIQVNDSNINFGTILSGQEVSSNLIGDNINITLSESIFKGSVFPMQLNFVNNEGYNRTEILNLTVGEIDRFSPVGPDTHGYYIYDMGDTDYNLVPTFDWIEIDTQYGGDGIDLNVSDSGNGNGASNSTKAIELPFIFNFYGEPYDVISVSTNGWIALGRTNLLSFRNYPIPGAGGPSPMIAAFWDDMKTTNGGDMFYKIIDNGTINQSIVIQWSDMRTYDNSSEEDFQVILTPNPDSETGDGDIKIQYKTFNNTSDGYYPEGGTPTHGSYATIGIENLYGNEGLQYTFNNQYAPGASPLFNNRAILITTELPTFSILGDINNDELINVLDIVLLVNLVLAGSFNEYADINGDSILNVLDIVLLVNIILESGL